MLQSVTNGRSRQSLETLAYFNGHIPIPISTQQDDSIRMTKDDDCLYFEKLSKIQWIPHSKRMIFLVNSICVFLPSINSDIKRK